ncbi:hypothetical protein MG293_000417 [Ovis ammon polii]|uniref:Uncharacterized protein n=1 Tax=Ovis ammon polii TaxID=230172 RepID=A0AAD4UKA4_OVIAM|nr:hypothetical protein MG293_000417 [Ovis ammon polii]
MKVKSETEVTQSCLTLCDPMDCSLPGSFAHGIFQARVLEREKNLINKYLKHAFVIYIQMNSQILLTYGEGNGNPLQYSCLENPMEEEPGNGNPLQCSSLENPRDGGDWWAVVYGVAQSRTRLKRLSSSRSY